MAGSQSLLAAIAANKGDGVESHLPRVETALPAYLAPAVSSAIWNGYIGDGQSLSLGAQGTPVLSDTQPYSNLTFSAGVKPTLTGNAFGGQNTSAMNASKALVEDLGNPDGSGNARGETICSGAVNGMAALAISEDGLAATDVVWFASVVGKGDTILSALVKGQPWYQNYIDHVTKANALAVAAGKTYRLAAIAWLHGEANSADSRSSYRGTVRTLFQDMQDDAIAITGQSVKPHIHVYQTVYDIVSGGGPALALFDLANERDDVHLASPIYHLPHYGDNVHLTNVGYLRWGHLDSRVLKDVLVDHIHPQHINPISVSHDAGAKTVTVQFAVPVGPLRFDTTRMAATQDMGFALSSSSGLATLTNVALVAIDTVALTYSGTLGTSPVVRYALDHLGTGLTISGGASGNLRDSTPDTFSQGGVTYPLHRVCPHFEVTIPYTYDANPNLFANGGLDSDTIWTKGGANLSISGGVATKTTGGGVHTLTQLLSTIQKGETYTLTYTVTAYTAGSVQVRWEGAAAGTLRGALGTYQETLLATSHGSASGIGLSMTNGFAGSVDNLSLRKAA